MELAAIGGMVLIFASADDRLARVQLTYHAADHGHDTAAGYLEHRIAVVRVFINDVLHGAFQLFQLLLHWLTSLFLAQLFIV